MATLILKWPVSEGTGSMLNESINGLEMYFATSGSYPAWATGPTGAAGTAITTSGSTDSTAYAATDSPITCAYTNIDGSGYVGLTIATRFKLISSEGGTVINSFYLDAGDRPSAGNAADPLLNNQGGAYTTIFVTSAGALAFGWSAARTSYYAPSIRAGTVTTDEWNVVIARLEAPDSASVYANGAWYTDETYRSGCLGWNDGGFKPSTFLSAAFCEQFWAIGKGESSAFCGGSDRSFSGDIGECRVYCGQLTDDEIEDLYDELITPPVRNAMMFSCNT